MLILGISAYYHDSAACILKDGNIIAAAQEERFTREKHDSSFPHKAILYCLNEAKISGSELDYITFYDKPFLKFDRIIETYLSFAPKGFKNFSKSLPIWIKEKLFQKNTILNELKNLIGKDKSREKKLLFSEHHLSHAASAFFPSPFERAAILSLDGVGEWATSLLAVGNKNNISLLKEIHFPHSLGLLYSAFTYYLGFKVNSGEYKMMGLAPYGSPRYIEKIKKNIINIKSDGSFTLNMSYFDYCTGLTMTSKKFNKLFSRAPRVSEAEISQFDMDIAASIQAVIEEVVLKMARNIKKETGENNLCLAGGVALNCVVNGALVRSKIFNKVWVQPAAGDAGGSLGAAFATYHIMLGNNRVVQKNSDKMQGAYLGPSFTQQEIKKALDRSKATYIELNYNQLIDKTAKYISEDKIIGWMNGRMEFGPRALGNRSIIASPKSTNMQRDLNYKIKYRESFRPFAPSILLEDLSDWFETNEESPYMLLVSYVSESKRLNVKESEKKYEGIKKMMIPNSQVPAITHVDFSARVQTVTKDINKKFYDLINKYKEISGCPILINTSFNVRGEPIVCTPEDAYNCFMGTELDILIIDNFLLKKEDQDPKNILDYKAVHELD